MLHKMREARRTREAVIVGQGEARPANVRSSPVFQTPLAALDFENGTVGRRSRAPSRASTPQTSSTARSKPSSVNGEEKYDSNPFGLSPKHAALMSSLTGYGKTKATQVNDRSMGMEEPDELNILAGLCPNQAALLSSVKGPEKSKARPSPPIVQRGHIKRESTQNESIAVAPLSNQDTVVSISRQEPNAKAESGVGTWDNPMDLTMDTDVEAMDLTQQDDDTDSEDDIPISQLRKHRHIETKPSLIVQLKIDKLRTNNKTKAHPGILRTPTTDPLPTRAKPVPTPAPQQSSRPRIWSFSARAEVDSRTGLKRKISQVDMTTMPETSSNAPTPQTSSAQKRLDPSSNHSQPKTSATVLNSHYHPSSTPMQERSTNPATPQPLSAQEQLGPPSNRSQPPTSSTLPSSRRLSSGLPTLGRPTKMTTSESRSTQDQSGPSPNFFGTAASSMQLSSHRLPSEIPMQERSTNIVANAGATRSLSFVEREFQSTLDKQRVMLKQMKTLRRLQEDEKKLEGEFLLMPNYNHL